MSTQRTSFGEILASFLLVAFFAAIYSPVFIFEANAHSGIKTEYTVTKTGWMNYRVESNIASALLSLRDRAEAKLFFTARGGGAAYLKDEFYVSNNHDRLIANQRYEFNLKCVKFGSVPDPFTPESCEIISFKAL